jgi:phosphomannomutase
MLLAEGKPLSVLTRELPQRFTASERIQNVPAELSQKLLTVAASQPELILQQLGMKDITTQSIDLTDGVRLTLSNGQILHFRASGNAPELRIYSEADTDITAKHLAQLGTQLKLN